MNMKIKNISILYLIITFLLFLYTLLEIVDNRVRLKYDASPEQLSIVPLKEIFRWTKNHELLNLQIYGVYIVLSFIFGGMVLYKLKKTRRETSVDTKN